MHIRLHQGPAEQHRGHGRLAVRRRPHVVQLFGLLGDLLDMESRIAELPGLPEEATTVLRSTSPIRDPDPLGRLGLD